MAGGRPVPTTFPLAVPYVVGGRPSAGHDTGEGGCRARLDSANPDCAWRRVARSPYILPDPCGNCGSAKRSGRIWDLAPNFPCAEYCDISIILDNVMASNGQSAHEIAGRLVRLVESQQRAAASYLVPAATSSMPFFSCSDTITLYSRTADHSFRSESVPARRNGAQSI
jgi:hypothetical protein